MIREAVFSGTFYEKDPKKLRQQVKSCLGLAKPFQTDKNLRAVAVPHAGYVYSGNTAAYGYMQIEQQCQQSNNCYENVMIVGLAHRVPVSGIALCKSKKWKTPLGEIKVSQVNSKLAKCKNFIVDQEAHQEEHSIEVQLPFLQEVLNEFSITPMLTGGVGDHLQIAQTLKSFINKETLLVVSTDLCHYLPYEKANEVDQKTIKKILNLNTNIDQNAACGADGIKILIELARLQKWQPKLLNYKNSGDTAGEKDKVVGYAAIAFFE